MQNEKLIRFFCIAFLLHVIGFLAISSLWKFIPLSQNYFQIHRYLYDQRWEGGNFQLLRSLNHADAQWYLHIAEYGYPKHVEKLTEFSPYSVFGSESYAYFPLYPLLLHAVNLIFRNVELTAFVISEVLLIVNFILFYYLLRLSYKIVESKKITLLLFFSPFSVFFRSYFSEGLFMFFLFFFLILLKKRKLGFASLALGLLIITRGTGLALLPLFILEIVKNREKLAPIKLGSLILLIILPLMFWGIFCYINTGDPLFFISIRELWLNLSGINSTFLIPIFNAFVTLNFLKLPFHSPGGFSKVDVCVFVITAILSLTKEKRILPLIRQSSMLFLIFHFFSVTLMSFSRYSLIFLTTYIQLGLIFKNDKLFYIFFLFWFISMIFVSLFFVNAYWVA